jgi:hypothetical protein
MLMIFHLAIENSIVIFGILFKPLMVGFPACWDDPGVVKTALEITLNSKLNFPEFPES